MCPEKLHDFNNVSLSRNTVVRRIEDLSANVKHQVSHKACDFDFYSIACDESTDAGDTAQLLIYLRGVDDNFILRRSCLISGVLRVQLQVKTFLKLCPMQLTRWDLSGTSCVESQQMELQL